MPLVSLAVVLVVIGILLYLVNNYIPLDPKISKILNIVVVVCVVLWLLNLFVGTGSLNQIRVGR